MSVEVAILIGAAIIAVAIVYGSWCIASIAGPIAALTHVFSADTHWVSDEELKEYDEPDHPLAPGLTFTQHLPPWSDPSAVEVFAWHLNRIVSALVAKNQAPTASTTEPPAP